MHCFDFELMDEKEMKEYLGEMDGMKDSIPQLIEEVSDQKETLEDCIRRKSLSGKDSEKIGISGGGMKPDTVYYTLLSVHRDMDKQLDETTAELLRYHKAQEKLRYVERCIKLLPQSDREMIVSLCIEHNKCESYAKKHGISRSAVFAHRKAAIQKLLVIYNMRFSEKTG